MCLAGGRQAVMEGFAGCGDGGGLYPTTFNPGDPFLCVLLEPPEKDGAMEKPVLLVSLSY